MFQTGSGVTASCLVPLLLGLLAETQRKTSVSELHLKEYNFISTEELRINNRQ